MVFLALKPIYYMITKTVPKSNANVVTWPEILRFMQTDFIKQVQELKADDIPEKTKRYVLD